MEFNNSYDIPETTVNKHLASKGKCVIFIDWSVTVRQNVLLGSFLAAAVERGSVDTKYSKKEFYLSC